MTPPNAKQNAPPILHVLMRMLEENTGQEIRLSNLLDAMGERGFGFVFIVFGVLAAALPAVLCSIMSLPILLFSLQLLTGQPRPVVPERFNQKTFAAVGIQTGLLKAQKWLRRIEIFAKPRWPALATPVICRLAALVCFALAVVILIPGPFTNTPPGIAICLFGFAMAQRDGLLMLLSFLAAVLAFIISLSVISALIAVLWAWLAQWLA